MSIQSSFPNSFQMRHLAEIRSASGPQSVGYGNWALDVLSQERVRILMGTSGKMLSSIVRSIWTSSHMTLVSAGIVGFALSLQSAITEKTLIISVSLENMTGLIWSPYLPSFMIKSTFPFSKMKAPSIRTNTAAEYGYLKANSLFERRVMVEPFMYPIS